MTATKPQPRTSARVDANGVDYYFDLHGHGRTTLGDRRIDPVDMGDSLGAGVAFRLGVQHPDKVRRLVTVSASYPTR
jgi:pimeloyl-ACP methyl ester carboxylesterase